MARPLWLRLFGPDGPTTISELRDALKSAVFGQASGDGHVTARLFELTGLTPTSVVRPGPGPDGEGQTRDRVLGTEHVAADAASRAADGASQRALDSLSSETGPVAAADPNDSRVFAIQAGADDQPLPLRRADLELVIPVGTDAQMLAQRERDENSMPNGSWTFFFNQHDYAGLAGGSDSKAEYDAAGFADLKASGQGFAADFDTLSLAGDFSAGFTLSRIDAPLGRVSLQAGSDYVLMSDDDFVRGDSTMIIDASKVGAGNHVMFDGSAETNGRISFIGSGGDDIAFGGAGNDSLRGGLGADVLTGGAGADNFIYSKASESTGPNYDVLADFNPLADRIDLTGKVTGFDATVQSGALSDGSFSHDLAAALAGLGANHAALFTPNSGDLAGTLFLVVDANGIAGYQEGEDYVFALPGTTLADLAGHTDLFI